MITEHRDTIDAIDEELVALFNRRAAESLAIRTLKRKAGLGLFDPKREEEIFEHAAKINEGPLFNDDLREIYQVILKVSKDLSQ